MTKYIRFEKKVETTKEGFEQLIRVSKSIGQSLGVMRFIQTKEDIAAEKGYECLECWHEDTWTVDEICNELFNNSYTDMSTVALLLIVDEDDVLFRVETYMKGIVYGMYHRYDGIVVYIQVPDNFKTIPAQCIENGWSKEMAHTYEPVTEEIKTMHEKINIAWIKKAMLRSTTNGVVSIDRYAVRVYNEEQNLRYYWDLDNMQLNPSQAREMIEEKGNFILRYED